MGKVLDITSRLKASTQVQNVSKNTSSNLSTGATEIVDMVGARQAQINRDRRQVKRTILSEFIGAYVILPDRGLLKISIYDISDDGISFDVPIENGHFQDQDEVAMRVYMNHKTYFPFVAKVVNLRRFDEDGVVRHGANFMKGTINDVALHHFIKFIETVSASLKTDDGDVLVTNIS